jgi:hypothetical protein
MLRSPLETVFGGSPRRSSGLLRWIAVATILLIFIWRLELPTEISAYRSHGSVGTIYGNEAEESHPIDHLINSADVEFADILTKETHDVKAAAAAYRKRRGRHPPPGFEAWFELAQENNAIIVEDFWDQIYHDLNPFWALEPASLRREAKHFEMTINVRNGNATANSDWFWTQIWLDLVRTIQDFLPDMDLALNALDEPRLAVPWEKIDGYMKEEKKSRKTPDPRLMNNVYTGTYYDSMAVTSS